MKKVRRVSYWNDDEIRARLKQLGALGAFQSAEAEEIRELALETVKRQETAKAKAVQDAEGVHELVLRLRIVKVFDTPKAGEIAFKQMAAAHVGSSEFRELSLFRKSDGREVLHLTTRE